MRLTIRKMVRLLPTAVPVAFAACATPSPDAAAQFAAAVNRLGLIPFYPLLETPRVGEIYIVDDNAELDTQGYSYRPVSYLLTDALVAPLEAMRESRPAITKRFAQSPTDLDHALAKDLTSRSFYKQQPQTDAAKAPGDGGLTLAAVPGSTFASVTDATAGGFVPMKFTTLLAGLGLRSSTSVEIRPDAVEEAEVTIDNLAQVLTKVCQDPATAFDDPVRGLKLTTIGTNLLEAAHRLRVNDAKQQHRNIPGVSPVLFLLTKVYYLRSIRYVFNSNAAAAAFAQAALASKLPSGVTAPTANNVSVNVNPTDAGNPPAVAADVQQLRSELDSIRSSIASGTATQIAASIGHATATGYELIDVFDRPLAFAYEQIAFQVSSDKKDGNKNSKIILPLSTVCTPFIGTP